MDQPTLTRLHSCLDGILQKFAEVCRKNNLTYFLVGGTALGAVRHKGFIPWDDDIDICMPRKDYDRFLKIANKELAPNFEIRNFKTHPEGHVYPWTKVEDKRTTLQVEWHKYLGYKSGVFMDIFPLDGFPDSQRLGKLHYKICRKLCGLYSGSFIDRDSLKYKGFTGRCKSLLINSFYRKIIYNFLCRLLRLYNYESHNRVCSMLGEYATKEIFPKRFWGKGAPITFEGNVYMGPEQCEEYLTHLYGDDYMQLPPVEKRTSGHDWNILDFDTPNNT